MLPLWDTLDRDTLDRDTLDRDILLHLAATRLRGRPAVTPQQQARPPRRLDTYRQREAVRRRTIRAHLLQVMSRRAAVHRRTRAPLRRATGIRRTRTRAPHQLTRAPRQLTIPQPSAVHPLRMRLRRRLLTCPWPPPPLGESSTCSSRLSRALSTCSSHSQPTSWSSSKASEGSALDSSLAWRWKAL